MKTAVVGGGAAGFFLAINLKEMVPQMDVTIFERHKHVLSKVAISGGGRCNCTNSFTFVNDLSVVYPRGHRLMKRLLKGFSQRDAYQWFEHRGVKLTTQDDGCVFPSSQDAHTIINLFLSEARRHNIHIEFNHPITSFQDQLGDYDFIAVTTGGSPTMNGLKWLADCGHEIALPVPSLFTFRIDDQELQSLMGTVVDHATAYLPGLKHRSTGPLLITHWGMSGPAILKLSSYAARTLAEQGYQHALSVNWTGYNDSEVSMELSALRSQHPQKQLHTVRPYAIPSRLWSYLLTKCLGDRAREPWASLNNKELNRLANLLSGGDTYQIAGRAPFKDEFVTCGGVALSAVNPVTLESRTVPRLYFAGEVLDVDGITGGFNFQAAWTTAFTVAKAISAASRAAVAEQASSPE